MNFDQQKATEWLRDVSMALPKIDLILRSATSDILIIGAGVFDVYHAQEWIPEFKRKTGDLDLSVGLVSGIEDYQTLKGDLLNANYKNTTPKYRFFTPIVVPGAITYIDLLAHPTGIKVSEAEARAVMGAGPEFSFAAMEFASLKTFQIAPHIFCPNPIGLTALKMASYLDDPLRRIKDLADIAELGWGLVEKGTHFQMKALWASLSERPEAKQVKRMLTTLGGNESVEWDLENARQELLSRNFSSDDIEGLIPDRLKEWASFLE